MAAPTVTVRQTPTGTHLFDGFPSKIVFALAPSIEIWEKKIKPSGVDGREPVDQTTMWNQEWTTVTPRKLRTLMPIEATCAYDVVGFSNLNEILNVIQSITHVWSDGSTLCFWGFLQKFELSEMEEGKQPELQLTIYPSNIDPSAISGKPTEYQAVISGVTGTALTELYALKTVPTL